MKIVRYPLVLAVAFAAGLIDAQTSAPTTVPASASGVPAGLRLPSAGEVAPDFSVVGPAGEKVALGDFKGKILIVDVSATWCGPCQAAMPNNDRVYRKYRDQGVVLLGITADDTRAAYDGWVQRNAEKYAFKMAFDPAGKDGWKDSVFNTKYHITGFPTMFVIGRDGKIVEMVSGGGPGEDYRLEYALARAGAKVDLASLPAEPKKDPNAPKSIPASVKTMAMPAMGMGAPAGASGGGFVPSKFGSIERGTVVPDFTVTGADNQPVKLSSFRGKTLLLHFVTGNGPQPWFTRLAATYRDQPLAILAVFSATDRAAFDQWVAAHPNPAFAVAWDPAGKAWAENVTNTIFGVGMYPASVVLNAKGELWGGGIGMGDKMTAMVYSMLARNGIKLVKEDMDALVAAGGAARMGGGSVPAATIVPKPGGAATASARPALLAAGSVAPDFVMRDVNDKEVHLADFKGKVVILDFWATWCGPCTSSFPHTQKLAAKYAAQDVVVLASGTSDTIAAFKKWIPANQPKYPDMRFVFDPNEKDSPTFEKRASASLYGVTGIPTQFVIGRDGKVVAALVGNGGDSDTRTEGALALAGVKVDEEVAAKGKAAIAAEAKERTAAAAKPAPARAPFMENYGKLKAGDPVPDLTLQDADGKAVKFSDISKGKTTVLFMSSHAIDPASSAALSKFATNYADQGVVVVGLIAYAAREDYDKWRTANAGKFSFTALFDPAGAGPKPAKPMDELTPEEKKAFMTRQREHMANVAPLMFTGGAMAPVPNYAVIDAQGKFVGLGVGGEPGVTEAVANMLLRAGVKLAAADMPNKVWTAAETKPAPPPSQVAMLKVGALAPDFPATDINGKPVKVSDFRGKIVILDFWATWCGPCIASMPHTDEVAAHYADQGVVVMASCTSDSRAAFDAWVKKNQEKFPHMNFSHDPLERADERASHKLYGVGGIPQQFIIGRDGRVAALCTGYLKGEVLLEAALARAGLNVAPEILAKAKLDQANRDAVQ